jgi:hypothetical protein
MSHRTLTLALSALALGGTAWGEMNPHFEPLRPLLGRTWRGTFPASTPEKPVVDVSRFEITLHGQAVRSRHSINDGDYGGESFIVWDETKQSLVYYYFTTAGFHTIGTMRVEDGALVSRETVVGAADGITEVQGTHRVLPDGRLHVRTRYLKNGAWVEGREMHYVEDPQAVVRFKDEATPTASR